jgi:hypothetical protein
LERLSVTTEIGNPDEREARFAALDRFRESLPEYDEAEVLADAMEAVEAVRRERAAADPAAAEPPPPLPPPAGEDVEMGGEAPCQLHRFWDPEE